MSNQAVCPKNPDHQRFVTVAYVSEDWVVDANGNFVEVAEGGESQVLTQPSRDNIWRCAECGTEAIFQSRAHEVNA